MVNDIVSTLPTGVTAPQFNDRFDEVYGVVYALTGNGYTYEEMREKAEKIRRILLDVPSVKKSICLVCRPKRSTLKSKISNWRN